MNLKFSLINYSLLISFVYCLPPPTIHCSDDLGQQLYSASDDGSVEKVVSLLDRGAPVNWRDSRGLTALHIACYNNSVDVVQVLAQQDDIDVNVQDDAKSTPLHWACFWGHIECVQTLYATGRCDPGKSVCVCVCQCVYHVIL